MNYRPSSLFRKMMNLVLSLAMVFSCFQTYALGYPEAKPDQLTFVNSEGNEVAVDESWVEEYPYGLFAFENREMTVFKSRDSQTMKVYRLGGTKGRAHVNIVYTPAYAQVSETERSYSTAAGKNDIIIEVEDALNYARFQPLAADPEPDQPAVPTEISISEDENGDFTLSLVGVVADSYVWYGYFDGIWTLIEDATDSTLVIGPENGLDQGYDFMSVYTIDGVRYGSNSAGGELYQSAPNDMGEYIDPSELADLIAEPYTQTFTMLPMDDENEYSAYIFEMVFAEDEWVKDIRITAPDNDSMKADVFGSLQLVGNEGAGIFQDASSVLVHITNENYVRSDTQVGFAVTDIRANKASGMAYAEIQRTGDIQYPVSFSWHTEDDTAIAGIDYAASEGQAVFYADVRSMEICVPLIAGSIPSEEDVSFYIVLTELLGGAEADASFFADTATISLYDSGDATTKNLATTLYDAELVDASASVVTQSHAMVDAPTPVTGNQIIEDTDYVPQPAEIVFGSQSSGIGTFSFSYGAKLNFSALRSNPSYNTTYWNNLLEQEHMNHVYRPSPANSNALGKYNWEWVADPANYANTRLRGFNGHDTGGSINYYGLFGPNPAAAAVNIPNIGKMFSSAYYYFDLQHRMRYSDNKNHGENWILEPIISIGSIVLQLHGSESGRVIPVSGVDLYRGEMKEFYSMSYPNGSSYGSNTFAFNETLGVRVWLRARQMVGYKAPKSNYLHQTDNDARAGIGELYLTRRVFGKDFSLKIYTANDVNTLHASSAPGAELNKISLLDATTELYDTLKPVISIEPGKGGVHTNGKLFVGSQLRISTDAIATYQMMRADTVQHVFLTQNVNGSDKVVAYGTVDAGNFNSASLVLMWDSLTEADLNTGDFTINIVLDRRQTVAVELLPSVPRQDDGINIDKKRIGEAWNMFAASNEGRGISIGYSVGHSVLKDQNSYVPHSDEMIMYELRTKRINLSEFMQNGTIFNSGVMENIQYVNFNLSSEDVILYSGTTYKGNETIQIRKDHMNSSVMVFRYYHKDYLNALSVMVPIVSDVALYLDANGNGKIDGKFDRTRNIFVMDPGGGDEIVGYMTQEAYEETQFAPVLRNGKYVNYFISMEYTITPRCLVVPPQASDSDRAQILPAFTTSASNANSLGKLTKEQRGYRFVASGSISYIIDDGYSSVVNETFSSDNVLMYGAEASRPNAVNFAAGGDQSPAVRETPGDYSSMYVWNPDFHGSLLFDFINPEPVVIEDSLAGKNIPIARFSGKDVNGDYLYEAGGVQKLNGFLGSLSGVDTFAITVVQQQYDGSKNLIPQNSLASVPVPEASRLSNISLFPNADHLLVTDSGKTKDKPEVASEGQGDYDEFGMDAGVQLPNVEISISDYVTIIIDGYDIGFAIGMPLGQLERKNEAGEIESTAKNPKLANEENVGKFRNFFTGAWGQMTKDDAYEKAKQEKASHTGTNIDGDPTFDENGNRKMDKGRMESSSLSVDFNLSLGFVFTYNPIDNGYYFSKMAISVAVSLSYKYTYRLSVCPIVYVYVKVSVGLELATGLQVIREVVEGKNYADLAAAVGLGGGFTKDGNSSIYKGEAQDYFVVQAEYKAYNLYFSGKLAVQINRGSSSEPNWESFGYITSYDIGKGVTVILKQQDAYQIETAEQFTVRFAAIEDTLVHQMRPIIKADSYTYWSGMKLSPSALFEIGAGLGIDMLKIELFAQLAINMSMTFGAFDVDTKTYAPFSFDEFQMKLGIGIRVVLLFFTIEKEAIQYILSYENGRNGNEDGIVQTPWMHGYSALGGSFARMYPINSKASTTSASVSTMSLMSEINEEESFLKLPQSTANRQFINGYSESMIMPMAFDPTDRSAPFQLSGYGSSGDAFTLVQGVSTGYDYQVVTIGETNYLLYHISRPGSNVNPLDATMLVLSEIVITGTNMNESGLANPVSRSISSPNYIVVDVGSNTGDLDFATSVSGDILHVAWTSYDKAAADDNSGSTDDKLLESASRNTIVKTASWQPGSDSFGAAERIDTSDTTASAGKTVFSPRISGDAVMYLTAEPYTETELAEAVNAYGSYLATAFNYSADDQDPGGNIAFLKSYYRTMKSVFGKTNTITVSAKNDNGIWFGQEIALTNSTDKNRTIENVELTQIGDKHYLAYTTSEEEYIGGELVYTKRLMLRTVTVDPAVRSDDPASNGTIVFGDPYQLRTIVNYDNSAQNSKDGVYKGASLTEEYIDPYFADMKFLNAKLGDLYGVEEQFSVFSLNALTDTKETFLLFEMNGNTYVIPENELANITSIGSGKIIPFFTMETYLSLNAAGQKVEEKATASGYAGVTIGADNEGNLAAVYVGTVPNTTNNAIFVSHYYSYENDQAQTVAGWKPAQMLAMHNMQIHEDAETHRWSSEETKAAYFHDITADAQTTGARQVKFSNLQFAMLAKDAEGHSAAQTLILAEAAVTKLVYVLGENETAFNAASSAVGPESEGSDVGFYAIAFGQGQQGIGNASVSLIASELKSGFSASTTVSFMNVGDTRIRASKTEPITVSLMLSNEAHPVAVWEMADSVNPGQEVVLSGIATIPRDVAAGDNFYFVVEEDSSGYVDDYFSGYSYVTPDVNDKNYPIGRYIVEILPDLGLERFSLKSVGVDDRGRTILEADFIVTNRGSAIAVDAFAQFKLQTASADVDGKVPYKPLDLTDHELVIGRQEKIEDFFAMFSIDYNLSNGILKLEGPDKSSDIAPGYARQVTGRFYVCPEDYMLNTTNGAEELVIEIELFSQSDVSANVVQYEAASSGSGSVLFAAKHNELSSLNNMQRSVFNHNTYYTAASNIAIPLGTPLLLPFTANTTYSEALNAIVSEEKLHDIDGSDPTHLGILYYDSALKCIAISPSSEGSGVIRVTDVRSNDSYDIIFTVTEPGEGINVYEDNDMFTFYNSDGSEYDPQGSNQDWKFWDKIPDWGNDPAEANIIMAPYRSDLARGNKGAYFTVRTLAVAMDVYFQGDIEISSTYPNFTSKNLSSYGGNSGHNAKRVNFALDLNAPSSQMHTVTMKVTSQDAQFDRYVEHYGGGLTPIPYTDVLAPHLYWSRSFPQIASVNSSSAPLPVTLTIIDDSGLVSVTATNFAEENMVLKKISSTFWQLEWDVTKNGSYTFTATDVSGNQTPVTVNVGWFSDSVAGDGAVPELNARVMVGSSPWQLNGALPQGNVASITYDDVAAGVDVNVTQGYFVMSDEEATGYGFAPVSLTSNGYQLSSNGVYRVQATNSTGEFSSVYLFFNGVDSDEPVLVLTQTLNTSGDSVLYYSATKGNLSLLDNANAGAISPISQLTLNGISLMQGSSANSVSGNWVSTNGLFNGTYMLVATDEAGNTSNRALTITNLDVDVKDGSIATKSDWTQQGGAGEATLYVAGVFGGYYDVDLFQANKEYLCNYEHAFMPSTDAFMAQDTSSMDAGELLAYNTAQADFFDNLSFTDLTGDVAFPDLNAGEYVLYIRDVLHPAEYDAIKVIAIMIAAEAIVFDMDTVESLFDDGSVQVTAYRGYGNLGTYQFAIQPVTTGAALLDASDPSWVWQNADNWLDIFNRSTFTGLGSSEYQIAVRAMVGVSQLELGVHEQHYNALRVAKEAYDSIEAEITNLNTLQFHYGVAIARLALEPTLEFRQDQVEQLQFTLEQECERILGTQYNVALPLGDSISIAQGALTSAAHTAKQQVDAEAATFVANTEALLLLVDDVYANDPTLYQNALVQRATIDQYYRVVFDSDGGVWEGGGSTVQSVALGQPAVEPVLSREGYIFLGWDSTFDVVASHMTVTAQWEFIPLTVPDENRGGYIAPNRPSTTNQTPEKQPTTNIHGVDVVLRELADGTIQVIVSGDQRKAIIDAAKEVDTIVIDLSEYKTADGSSVTSVRLNRSDLRAFAAARKNLEILYEGGSVHLPVEVLEAIVQQAQGTSVDFVLIPQAFSDMNEAMQQSILAMFTDIDVDPTTLLFFEVHVSSSGEQIAQFEGHYLMINLKYYTEEGDLVTVWHVDSSTGTLNLMASSFSAGEGSVSFSSDHLSLFAVGLQAKAEEQPPVVPDDPDVEKDPDQALPETIVLVIGSRIVRIGDEDHLDLPVAPEIMNGRAMLPFRYLIQTLLGGTVDWFEDTRTVKATIDGVSFELVIDELAILIDGEPIDYGQAPVIVSEYTLVPLRAFEKVVQYLDWNDDSKEVTIYRHAE